MAEDQAPPEAAPEGQEGEAQGGTTTIPLSVVGSKQLQPGETLQFSVVSIDQQQGAATIAYKQSPESTGPKGSDALASEFGKQPSQSAPEAA
jgi:hypothetical protein